jgi:hypothetical protein
MQKFKKQRCGLKLEFEQDNGCWLDVEIHSSGIDQPFEISHAISKWYLGKLALLLRWFSSNLLGQGCPRLVSIEHGKVAIWVVEGRLSSGLFKI